jgi:hypothetical protein
VAILGKVKHGDELTIIDQSHINKFGIAIAVVLPVPGGAATMTESVSFVLINLLPKTPNTMPLSARTLFSFFAL